MRSRPPRPEHEAAVARRLELLSQELALVRDERPTADGTPGPTRVRVPEPAPTHTRIRRPLELAPAPPPPELAEPVEIPEPGRHASRRMGAMAEVVPASLRGRVALGAGQVAVLAVVVAVALALLSWWVVRSQGSAMPVPVELSPSSTALVDLPSASASPSAPPKVVVDVTGKVRRPGIAVLHSGSRVVDALRAAGGARPGVDLGALNLARVLVDGEQIVVGQAAPAGAAASSVPSTGGTPTGTLVNLNTADETTLESLPDVGPVTAQAILAWRDAHGAFTSVDELLEVDGIGDVTLAKLTPYVTL